MASDKLLIDNHGHLTLTIEVDFDPGYDCYKLDGDRVLTTDIGISRDEKEIALLTASVGVLLATSAMRAVDFANPEIINFVVESLKNYLSKKEDINTTSLVEDTLIINCAGEESTIVAKKLLN